MKSGGRHRPGDERRPVGDPDDVDAAVGEDIGLPRLRAGLMMPEADDMPPQMRRWGELTIEGMRQR
jgi:hypothetical protein